AGWNDPLNHITRGTGASAAGATAACCARIPDTHASHMSAAVPHTRIQDPRPAAMASLLDRDGRFERNDDVCARCPLSPSPRRMGCRDVFFQHAAVARNVALVSERRAELEQRRAQGPACHMQCIAAQKRAPWTRNGLNISLVVLSPPGGVMRLRQMAP